ncbi:MAG TPA: ribonuclease HII [Longimicrobiales bacterium]|nr:ribonuclease HII [Longimicrobiales bacterium]
MPDPPEPTLDGLDLPEGAPEKGMASPDAMTGQRPQDPLAYERGFWGRGCFRVAGVDEVGRGPLAGPVVACAVVLPPDVHIDGATDSKRLTREERESLAPVIRRRAAAVALGAASVREIDRMNILVATRLAMRRALAALPEAPGHVVVDGLPVKGLGWKHDAVVEGDAHVHCIACASIVAKVVRDELMCRLARRYPGYGWETNVGYGSAAHREAVETLGSTPHHRLTFLGLQYGLDL